jgi:energy-coupling factor transporter ATP-binding protein EcfA2
MNPVLADYESQRQVFKTLLQEDCPERILFFHGASGSGKTTLITHCKSTIPESFPCIPVQLRGSIVNMAEIFYRAGRCLDWENLTNFTGQVADLQGSSHIQIDHNFIRGMNNRINVALHAESPLDRQHRQVILTEAWFDERYERLQ